MNIAGAVPQIDLLEMTDAQWDDGMALKLHGARRITIHAWNALKESKGSVVFTSGNSAEAPKSAYAAVATSFGVPPRLSVHQQLGLAIMPTAVVLLMVGWVQDLKAHTP